MPYKIIALVLALQLVLCGICLAWDGFDADSAELVEIIPGALPSPGDQVEVRSYDTDKSQQCRVQSVRQNRRTIEVVVMDDAQKTRTLVMENI